MGEPLSPIHGDAAAEARSRGGLTMSTYAGIKTPRGEIEYVEDKTQGQDASMRLSPYPGVSNAWEITVNHDGAKLIEGRLFQDIGSQKTLLTLYGNDEETYFTALVARPSTQAGYWEVEQLQGSQNIDFATERLIVIPDGIGVLEEKILLQTSVIDSLDKGTVEGIEAITNMLVSEGVTRAIQDLTGVRFGFIRQAETSLQRAKQASVLKPLSISLEEIDAWLSNYTSQRRLSTNQGTGDVFSKISIFDSGDFSEIQLRPAPDTRLLKDHEDAEATMAGGYRVAARVDIGNKRENMEDGASFMEVTSPNGTKLILVQAIDGMGGHDDGQIARELSIGTIAETFKQQILLGVSPDKALATAAQAADTAVTEYNKMNRKNSGAAGVVACINPITGNLFTFNVGDSRAYGLTAEGFSRITTDHSLAERDIQAGRWNRRHHRSHPRLNIILSSFGGGILLDRDLTTDSVENDMPFMQTDKYLHEDARMLLCTDGVWDVVEDFDIEKILSEARTPAEAAKRIVEAAKAAGGPDNITAVVVFGPNSQPKTVKPSNITMIDL